MDMGYIYIASITSAWIKNEVKNAKKHMIVDTGLVGKPAVVAAMTYQEGDCGEVDESFASGMLWNKKD